MARGLTARAVALTRAFADPGRPAGGAAGHWREAIQRTLVAGGFILAGLHCAGPALAAAQKDYGKPGEPVKLVVGYQPYYTESWSGVIMRGKKFYEKYLPKGSTVEFQIGLQGAIIVNNARRQAAHRLHGRHAGDRVDDQAGRARTSASSPCSALG